MIQSEMKKFVEEMEEKEENIVKRVEQSVADQVLAMKKWWVEEGLPAAGASFSSTGSSGSEREGPPSSRHSRKPLWSADDCTVENIGLKLGRYS